MTLKAMATKTKTSETTSNSKALRSKGNLQQNEKGRFQTGENISKPYIW